MSWVLPPSGSIGATRLGRTRILPSELLELLERGRPAWQADAACREATAVNFYPGATDAAGALPAKAVCATCLVRVDCLDYALRTGDRNGVWGGLSEQERRKMLRARQAADPTTG